MWCSERYTSASEHAREVAESFTAYGENFSQLLQALGAPGGVIEGAVHGALPAGWPTW